MHPSSTELIVGSDQSHSYVLQQEWEEGRAKGSPQPSGAVPEGMWEPLGSIKHVGIKRGVFPAADPSVKLKAQLPGCTSTLGMAAIVRRVLLSSWKEVKAAMDLGQMAILRGPKRLIAAAVSAFWQRWVLNALS